MSITFSERYKLYQPVVLSDTFEVTFPVFDDDDLRVDVDGVDEPLFYVTATYSDGVSNDAVITLASSVTGVDVEIYGARAARRENNYLANSPNLSANLQRDMDAITGVQQEQSRDFGRGFKVSRGVEAVTSLAVNAAARAGRIFGFSNDGLGLVIGATFDEISAAQGYSVTASAKADEASDSAAAAAASVSEVDAVLDSFDDRYLGAKAIEPTVDNDGDPLLVGALYYKSSTPDQGMYIWDGMAWGLLSAGQGLSLLRANNLSDLNDPDTALTSLGFTANAIGLIKNNFLGMRNLLSLGTAALADTGTANGDVPVLDGSGKVPFSAIPADQVMIVWDQKTSGTAPQSLPANTWTVREINRNNTTTIPGASLASNQITLPAGTYQIHATAQGFRSNGSKLRLYDATNSAVLLVSNNGNSHSSFNTTADSTIFGRFILTGTSAVQIEQIVATASAGGVALSGIPNNTEVEIYTQVVITKVA